MSAARAAIADRRFPEALDALQRATALGSHAPEIAELTASARNGQTALEAEARKQQEIDAHLADASRHLTRGNLTKASEVVDVVLRIDSQHEGARALHDRIQQAIEIRKETEERAAQERERKQQIEDMLASAEAAPTNEAAIEILNKVLTLDAANGRAQRVLRKRQADLDRAVAEQKRLEAIKSQGRGRARRPATARRGLDGLRTPIDRSPPIRRCPAHGHRGADICRRTIQFQTSCRSPSPGSPPSEPPRKRSRRSSGRSRSPPNVYGAATTPAHSNTSIRPCDMTVGIRRQ